MAVHPELAPLLREPRRAGSLAITLFGDVISVHGGEVWLASLVRMLGAFGLNERQARTALFRLVQDDWLDAEQDGRRSFYRFSAHGRRQFEHAATRIYATELPDWDGEWTLVMPTTVEAATRDTLRRRLGWLGFATIASGVLAHPAPEHHVLAETIADLGLVHDVMVWRARTDSQSAVLRSAADAWDLDTIAARFTTFVETYSRFECIVDDFEQAEAFLLRALLIHDYRRVLLKTPALPAALLSDTWRGHDAMRLVQALYRALHERSVRHARQQLENREGALPAAAPRYFQRFGGLGKRTSQAPASAA